jgi:hypothetical protein
MKILQTTLLVSAMLVTPLALAQAQSGQTAPGARGEMPESSKPDPNPPPTKTPMPSTAPTTGTSTGEAPYSSMPGTDKPATTNAPGQKMHQADMPKSDTMPSSGSAGANPTAPSGETPPAGAPMRTGPQSNSNEGAGTLLGTDKK